MRSDRAGLAAFVIFSVISVLAALGYGHKIRPPLAAHGDTPDYLAEAYHLYARGTFSSAVTSQNVSAGIGREPGYATFLAIIMAVDPGFATFTPECLTQAGRCDDSIYRVPQMANAALIGLSGLTLFCAVHLLSGSVVAAGIAGGYLLLNMEMHKNWYYLASDHLALWLLTVAMLAAVWAARGGWRRWGAVGGALALLTLVKAVFLPFTLLALAVGCCIAAVASGKRRVLVASVAVGAVYMMLIGGWIVRNAVSADRVVFTDARSGIALSTREVFNRMTSQQYAASFVFWTRGFGDDLAKRLFPPEVVDPFELDHPGGFYDVGQLGYGRRVGEIMQSRGIGEAEAVRELDRSLIGAIARHPIAHAVTTLPLFYRGIWVDEFIVVGLPVFAVMLVTAVRRRDWLLCALFGIGAFNLIFYALISLNIPRYQMTAVPSIAIAAGIAAAGLAGRYRGRPAGTTAAQAPPAARGGGPY